MSQGLKRSQKTDFSTNSTITRERSFVRPNKDKRKSQNMGKPTMEIYRPPNVRTDLPQPKLNVHAKEFTMNNELQTSKSTTNIALMSAYEPLSLQHSKSSGNILRHIQNHPLIPLVPAGLPIPLLHSNSSSLLTHLPRVNFHIPNDIHAQQLFGHQTNYGNWNNHHHHHHNHNHHSNNSNSSNNNNSGTNLKRSKSLGAADSQNLAAKLKTFTKEETNLGKFPLEDETNLNQAQNDPNQLPSRTLMELVKIILERVVEGIRYSESGAKLCMSIIEKEKNQTFLESLLNTCQQWYQERDKILRGIKAGDGTRFTAFMWFLTEMCGQLKRHQLRSQFENLQPDLVLLSVLAKCCQACVSLPIKCLAETECLFFVLTSIGRDLENELPSQLEQLLGSVRDGFLASAGAPAVRRTLLQLIELHASNWQLPGSSVLYYYPRIK